MKTSEISTNQILRVFIIGMLAIVSAGCETDRQIADPTPMHYDYLPIDSGRSITYEMDSLVYDNFRDTIHQYTFMVTDRITGIFLQDHEDTIYRVERTYRDSAGGTDKKVVAYLLHKTRINVRRTINNMEHVLIVFPPFEGKEWDANAFNPGEPELYTISEFNAYFEGRHESFTHTATVIEEDRENLIERNLRKRIYAKNVGLVFYELMDLSYQDTIIPDPSIPWEERANEGYIVRFHYLDHHELGPK